MPQMNLIVLLLKIGCICGFVSLTSWVVLYSMYAAWWRDQIGRTLVIKTLLIAALLVPTALSLFLRFSRLTSMVAGWVDVCLIWLITPVMLWRIAVWHKIHKRGGGPHDTRPGRHR